MGLGVPRACRAKRKVMIPATFRSWDLLDFPLALVWGTGPAELVVFREWWLVPVLGAELPVDDLVQAVRVW